MKKNWLFVLAAFWMFGCAGSDDENLCGNGIVDAGEACDDGNTKNGDGCSSQCKVEQADAVCGNGKKEVGEQCDDNNLIDGDGCSARCLLERITVDEPVCGNGKLENEEECDDENLTNGDGCSSQCTLEQSAVCGNGRLEMGEACDDNNTLDGDGCSSTCQIEPPRCGNGKKEVGEECDGTDGVPTACSTWKPTMTWKDASQKPACDPSSCVIVAGACVADDTVCGNGTIDTDKGEKCDPADATAFTCSDLDNAKIWQDGGAPTCSAQTCQLEIGTCVEEKCGNGVKDDGEVCDWKLVESSDPYLCSTHDAKYISGSMACTRECAWDTSNCVENSEPECGNGSVEGTETCDWKTETTKACDAADPAYTANPDIDGAMAKCTGCSLDMSECVRSEAETGLVWCQTMDPINLSFDPTTAAQTVKVRYSVGADVDASRIDAKLVYGTDFKKILSEWVPKDATHNAAEKRFTASISGTEVKDFASTGDDEIYYAFKISVDGGETWSYCETNKDAPAVENFDIKPVSITEDDISPTPLNAHTTGHAVYTSDLASDIIAKFAFENVGADNTAKTYTADEGTGTLALGGSAGCNNSAQGGCYTSGADKCISANGWKGAENDEAAALDDGAYIEISGMSTSGATGIRLELKAWRNAKEAPTQLVVLYKTAEDGTYTKLKTQNIKEMKSETEQLLKTYTDYTFNFTSAVENQEKFWIKLVPYGGNGFLRLDDITVLKNH